MFFQEQNRCSYASPQLREVICQLRFPAILSINEKAPAALQEAIREAFPLYHSRVEQAPPRPAGPNSRMEQGQPVVNHAFVSDTGIWKLNLTQGFIALSTLRYNGWEDFARRLDRPLAEFIRIYRPAFFDRTGLRYVNIFSRKALSLEEVPWRELFRPAFLGPLAEDDVDERTAVKCSLDTEMRFSDGVFLKLHSGPGMVRQGSQQDPEVKFILDIDCSASGRLDGNMIPDRLAALHSRAGSTFRGAISHRLHEAMGAAPV